MSNPLLSEKYKGKTFGEISKSIESKYQDRFDPISRRGLMAEMGSLRDQQEYVREKEAIRQQMEQMLAQQNEAQQMGQIGSPMDQGMQIPQVDASNMGAAPQFDTSQMSAPQGHPSSQSYNQQFAFGGFTGVGGGIAGNLIRSGNQISTMPIQGLERNINDIPNIGFQNFLQNQARPQVEQSINNFKEQQKKQETEQGINPLRYAPMAANLASLFSARRAPSTQSELSRMGFRDRVDESLASGVTPRQTQFGNVDMSQIERGITNQARGFSGANLNVSGGQSGQFLANELANQSNVMNAIGQARMQAQGQDRQTQAMNAQEQARIDQFRQAQQGQLAGIQAQNIGMGMQMADLDARNLGAFNTFRNQQMAGFAQNVGNAARESDQMKMIANALGYNSFGQYVQNLSPEEKKGLLSILNSR